MASLWPFGGPSSRAQGGVLSKDAAPSYDDLRTCASATIPPLIICEGFLSAAQSVVWGNEFRTYLGVGHQQFVDQMLSRSSAQREPRDHGRKRRSGLGSDRSVIFAPIGPVSSLHDRACELFYALRGGTVDYGEQHSRQHGHSRFGRPYHQGLCPRWGLGSNTHTGLPAHFIGHSLGGPTILKLQQLLRQGFFDHALGLPSQSEWKAQDLILSITSVSSPFRGTPLVYSLGSEPLPYPKVRMFSFGDVLSKLVHIAAYLDLPFFDAHADAWHFSAKRRRAIKRSQLAGGSVVGEESTKRKAEDVQAGVAVHHLGVEQTAGVKDFLKQLWKSDWAGGRDCAPWDCTFAERDLDRASDQWGVEVNVVKRKRKTWYRSYAGGMTVADDCDQARPRFHRPETYWSLSPLTYTAHRIGHFDYSRLQPCPSFLSSADDKHSRSAMESLDSKWWANDGVVPLASQFHPFDCDRQTCRHFHGMSASLPFGTRSQRAESVIQPNETTPDSTSTRISTSNSSPTWPSGTLVNVHDDNQMCNMDRDAFESCVLPPPATHSHSKTNRSMIGSARSAIRIAYFTSLRAINLHDPPLVTPSEEELGSFLRDLARDPELGSAPSASRPAPPERQEHDRELQRHLLDPADNQWYTFEIDNLDHTSLCPFWTGSEVQKQFWTGIGLFLASVDRKAGFPVEQQDESVLSA
ncbi:uncharacterized protein UMAG_00749 [Mycosarcoma maydis]|uniref:Lipase-like C-terminal domain-containing protein n=1 Tax=Mycosarcoma maydis TaxID=5270 RepID=A0A0D1D1S6_MYCMD|nr:uncharacterized protein UMAG_00749 [Ustilago maydis 521]KIS72343.1 hypothetical protein UMAG_00749 [Ustilago maydis 521]|eukprot:XP_011386528.1 hypothetical protein UMAG_00749 [Ustilago maydis 521]